MEGTGEEPLGTPREDPARSGPVLAMVASVGISVAALVLAAIAGSPYLDLSDLNIWVAVFALAAFAALFSVPFAIERMLKAAHPERDEYTDRTMLIWGAVATVALALGGVLIAAGGFDPGGSLADAVGLLLAVDAGMILVTLLAWLLSG